MRGAGERVRCCSGQHRSPGTERSGPGVRAGKGVWTEEVRRGMVSLRMRGTPAEEQGGSQSRLPRGPSPTAHILGTGEARLRGPAVTVCRSRRGCGASSVQWGGSGELGVLPGLRSDAGTVGCCCGL